MRLRILILLVAAVPLLAPALAHAEKRAPKSPTPVVKMLPPVGDYPDAPCSDPATDGGNFYLSPTGDFWECICEVRTFVPHDCAWYNQGPLTSAESRRLRAKLRRSSVPRGWVINTHLKVWRLMPV